MKREHRVDYKARNILTGQIFVAGAEELAKILNTTSNSVYRTACMGTKLRGVWDIEKVTSGSELKDPEKNIPYSLRVEWDRVTQPFKVLSRRRAARAN